MTGAWNRSDDSTAAGVNLDAAPSGFKVTGDAAWDSDSADYAMFGGTGNAAVAAMVRGALQACVCWREGEVLAWVRCQTGRIASQHPEIRDTMVRETVAYALDEAWEAAYGHRFPGGGASGEPITVNAPGDG
jgi:hypothetical protein